MSSNESKSESGKAEEQAPPIYPNYPPPYQNYPPEEKANLLDYWKVLVEYKKLIGITTITGVALALIVVLVTTPIYRAETLLAPVTEKKSTGLAAIASQYGGLAELAGVNVGGDSDVEESIATLKSRKLAVAFIKQENLMPILFPNDWDKDKKEWKNPKKHPTYWQAYKYFDSKIRFVYSDNKSGLVTLVIKWKDPQFAATWANRLIELVNEKRRKEAIEEAEKSIAYLEQQLATTGVVEVQQAIYRLIEAQTKNKMVANTRSEYSFKVIDPAIVPNEAYSPKKLLLILFGILIGLISGIFITYVLESIRKNTYSR